MSVDLETLSKDLAKKFGEDAAQHALMRIVERGWHLDAGDNKVEHFASVCAANYRKTAWRVSKREPAEVDANGYQFGLGQDHRPDPRLREEVTPERVALSRIEIERTDPTVVAAAAFGIKGAAERLHVPEGTVKSRCFRRRPQ